MKPALPILLTLLLFSGCTTPEESSGYTVHDYRNVKLYLDTLNAKLQAEYDSTGTYTIPYTDLSNESNKHLIFFGTSHTRDSSHPQWAQLIKAFNSLNPQIAFNEGGQIASDKHFPTIDSAIHSNGETGVLKYLSDSTGITMMNGDMDDNEEFAALLAEQPRDQI